MSHLLTTCRPDSEWSEFGPGDYYLNEENGTPSEIHFQCPGCGHIIGVRQPPWVIDFNTFTATGSILHTRPDGCGWHGFLTNGNLEGRIE